jgi:hypothetical protein
MRKYILIILTLYSFLHGADIVRYQTENRSSMLDDKLASTIIKNATSSNFKFETNTPVCKDLYKFVYDANENVKSKTKIKAEKYLIDFNYREGTFTCSYVNNEEFGDGSKSITLSIPNWTLLLGYIDASKDGANLVNLPYDITELYNLFNGEYKPNNLSVLPQFSNYKSKWDYVKEIGDKIFSFGTSEGINTTAYNVEKRAIQLGLPYLKNGNDLENFTVSQFVTGLITLNPNVVTGVDASGDITINPDVSNKMAVLDDIEYSKGVWESFKDNVSTVINKATGGGIEDVQSKSVYSFEQYFDKKIFGLYYDYMAIGWQSVFNYAGMIILAFVFLYSGGVIGVKYLVFRLNRENENKEFEFPFSARLGSIIVLFVLFFLHFPVGNGTTTTSATNNTTTSSDSPIDISVTQTFKTENMPVETTIFKTGIGFMGDMGATIADYGAVNATVLYMKYLFKATNTSSIEDTVNVLNQNRRDIVEQAILQSFFIDNCITAHKDKYSKLNGFQTASSHIDLLWGNKNGSSKIFEGEGTISPLMCKNLEVSLMAGRQYLKKAKEVSEKTIDNLSNNSKFNVISPNSSYTSMSQLYVDTQLLGVKSVGWYMASTLPISHIFMLNSNIINNTHNGLVRTTNGEAVTTMLINKANSEYVKTDEDATRQTLDTEILNSTGSNWLKNSMTTLTSYQVYAMMPFFNEIREFFAYLVIGAKNEVLEVVGMFMPQGKLLSFAKSAIDKYSKETGEAKSKALALLTDEKSSNAGATYEAKEFKDFMIYVSSFVLAVIFYTILVKAIFAGIITLLAILKITLYVFDCFVYYFVSPFILLWNFTTKERTDKVNAFFVDGFILFMIRPTLIVTSFFIFIIGFELMVSFFSLMTDIAFSMLNLSNSLYEDSSFALSFVTESIITGFMNIFIYVIGMGLAYFIILKGDDIILARFQYKGNEENGIINQLGGKIQKLAEARV